MKTILYALFIAFVFAGCEKVVDLKYKDNQSRVVIEGDITNEEGPYFVQITKSIRLSGTDDYPSIDNAVVTLSDGTGNSEILTPGGNGVYRSGKIKGVPGKTYSLTVNIEGEVYTAQSTMPQPVPLDSIKVEEEVVIGETEYNIIPKFTDPAFQGNNYRFVLLINGKLINQHFILDDVIRNGLENTQRLEINDDDLKLKKGDAVSLQMECIDDKVALYYKTLALMADSGPGGGTTPNNPPNNISNGALGLFSAHTVEIKEVTIL